MRRAAVGQSTFLMNFDHMISAHESCSADDGWLSGRHDVQAEVSAAQRLLLSSQARSLGRLLVISSRALIM